MRKWFFAFCLIAAMLVQYTAHAQDSVSLSSMTIEIWPEYDKPSVLVIYRMTLSSATTFPANVSIRIPTTAGAPNAVAELQADGSLYSINYTRQVDGNWASINFTTTASQLQLEYYDPGMTKDGDARHFEYTWPGDYAVAQLNIQVQEPLGATNMRITPSLGAGSLGTDGLTYYSQDLGAVAAGQDIQITIDYKKTSDATTAESLPIEPSASIPQSTASDLSVSTLLPWIVGIIGAGLIIGGGIWFWQSGRQRPVAQTRRRRSRVRTASQEVTGEEDVVYCSQCGKRALPGDQFCRSCGTPIHVN